MTPQGEPSSGRASAPARADPVPPFADALNAALLFAVDPEGLGGVRLRGPPDPLRDRWLAGLREALPPATPFRRIPAGIAESRLFGGLDLAATLQAGRPVAERGLLAEADGGIVVLALAERAAPFVAAGLSATLDTHQVQVERDGITACRPARIGLVALDEGEGEEAPSPALCDRLGLVVDLRGLRPEGAGLPDRPHPLVEAARRRLRAVTVAEAAIERLCAVAAALGVPTLRAPLLALRAARASAALAGRDRVEDADLVLAARLVLAPRATRLPSAPQDEDAQDDAPPPDDPGGEEGEPEPPPPEGEETASAPSLDDDVVLAAAKAALPPDLLARLALAGGALGSARSSGRSGAERASRERGRPAGVRRGDPRRDRLDLVETLRTAAPWQALRRREAGDDRVRVEPGDMRIRRRIRRARTTTIFLVDASGSAAFQRLGEAKGAVELLLAECYVRRDEVALIAFRDRKAELLLPPTRSLVRAKRCLAALPGGGATPLAAGLEAGRTLAEAIRRKGDTAVVVLLTDGRANITRDGRLDRPSAAEDARAGAKLLRAAAVPALLVDTSPRPDPTARDLAGAMGALYLPLPRADRAALGQVVAAASRLGGRP